MRVPSLAVLLLLALPVAAQPFEYVASGDSSFSPGLSFLKIIWQLDEDFPREYPTELLPALAPAPSGDVVASFFSSSLWVIRPDGSRRQLFEAVPGYHATGLIFDRTGKAFLLANEDGFTNRCHVIRRSATGAVERIFSLNGACPASIDLAADQCTLLLARGQAIRRFDGCTGTALPDFATSGGPSNFPFFDARILPDGGVLATIGSTIRRYDAQGALVRTYTFENFVDTDKLAIESSGTVLFTGDFAIYRLDLESGAYTELEYGYPLSYTQSIVAGAPFTAALGPVHLGPNPIPTLSWQWLAALAAILGAVAAVKMPR